MLYLSKAMQSYDFLLDCPNIFMIIFKVFCKLLIASGDICMTKSKEKSPVTLAANEIAEGKVKQC